MSAVAEEAPEERRRRLPLVGIGLVLLATIVVRLPFLRLPLIPDEAGFYQVAQAWSLHGPNLYGHYFVDRPPGLEAMYKVAALTGHILAIRVIALGCALAVVVCVAWAAYRLGGAVVPAALVAAAFVSTPVDESVFASSGMYALPWMALGITLLVEAVHRTGRASYLLAWGSGLAGIAAMSAKQNFADSFVFAVVALVVLVVRREATVRRALALALAGVVGVLTAVLAMVLLAVVSTDGLHGLWLSAVDFRFRASGVILGASGGGTTRRMLEVVGVLVVTGMVPVAVVLVARGVRCLGRGSAWSWAIAVTVGYEIFSVFAGGSYWPHYALQFTPALALAVGLAWRPSLPVRLVAGLAMASAVLNLAAYGVARHQHPTDNNSSIGHWVAASAKPGDTATVLYGHAEVQWATGMRSPYAYLWSLPTRTLDPHLRQLTRVVSGKHAPTWVVTFNPPNAWHLDRSGRFRAALHARYVQVGAICARPKVWLRRDASRAIAPKPRCEPRFLEPDWYVVDFLKRYHLG